MAKHFESKMTIAAGFCINRTNDINEEFDTYDLPQPEGYGWQLKQVVPVHNNTRFLQYFWEREIEIEDSLERGTVPDGQIKNATIKLSN
jgi:hypothetical protein